MDSRDKQSQLGGKGSFQGKEGVCSCVCAIGMGWHSTAGNRSPKSWQERAWGTVRESGRQQLDA